MSDLTFQQFKSAFPWHGKDTRHIGAEQCDRCGDAYPDFLAAEAHVIGLGGTYDVFVCPCCAEETAGEYDWYGRGDSDTARYIAWKLSARFGGCDANWVNHVVWLAWTGDVEDVLFEEDDNTWSRVVREYDADGNSAMVTTDEGMTPRAAIAFALAL